MRRQTVNRADPITEEATFASSSREPYALPTHRNTEAKAEAVLATTSLSSDYKTAEPFLSQAAEGRLMSQDRECAHNATKDCYILSLIQDADCFR